MTIVTRFSPSPTGLLHIGGARTALFSWLYARHYDGRFLLRIEDTDSNRSDASLVQPIIDGLAWLGIHHDDEIVYQSHNADRHREVAEHLIDIGAAYRDYTSSDDIDKMRSDWSRDHKGPFRYSSEWRDTTGDPSLPHVIRFKSPKDGSSALDDRVQGIVTVKHQELEDFIILRTDKSPTFLLACTVDDNDMGINTVIRGDDHLNNAFKQILILDALGWTIPSYAHIPLIHNAEGKKLSKRDGAAGLDDYTDYLPDAVFNYLLRLGWGYHNQEIFTRKEAITLFDVKNVGRNPARLDEKKLLNINAHYLREASAKQLGVVDHFILPEVKKRSKRLSEVKAQMAFLDTRPAPITDRRASDIAKYLDGDWTHDRLDEQLKLYAHDHELKFGEAAGVVRVALTGQTQHIGVHDILLALGREESLARLTA